MFNLSILFALLAVFAALASFLTPKPWPTHTRKAAVASAALAALFLFFASLTTVPASNVGVQTRFGAVQPTTLPEGLHLVPPWVKVTKLYMAQQRRQTQPRKTCKAFMQTSMSPLQSTPTKRGTCSS